MCTIPRMNYYGSTGVWGARPDKTWKYNNADDLLWFEGVQGQHGVLKELMIVGNKLGFPLELGDISHYKLSYLRSTE